MLYPLSLIHFITYLDNFHSKLSHRTLVVEEIQIDQNILKLAKAKFSLHFSDFLGAKIKYPQRWNYNFINSRPPSNAK